MSRCLRHVFVSFNFLFWIFGIVLLGLGLFAEFDPAFVHRLVTFVDGIEETFTEDDADAPPAPVDGASAAPTGSPLHAVATYVRLMSHGVIALGAAISFVAFSGCCGAWRQSKRCLSIFFTLLLLCLLLTLLLGGALFFAAVAASTEKDTGGVSWASGAPETSDDSAGNARRMDPVVAKIAAGFKTLVESAWNALTNAQRLAFERANHCCSLYDPEDLFGILGRADCGSNMASRGCFDKVVSVIGRNFAIFGGAMLVLAALEVAAMSLSCVIFQRIRRTYGAV